ncbi:MAG: hypothetical protein JSW59_05980, partial [Phycisphaerales bacterium]
RQFYFPAAGNALQLCHRPRRGFDNGRGAGVLRRRGLDRLARGRNPSSRPGSTAKKADAQRRSGTDYACL